MAEDTAVRLFKEHFQVIYEQGGRWGEQAKEIAEYLKKGSAEGAEIISLTCTLIEQASDWEDLTRRFNAVFDPLQMGQGGATFWFYGNMQIKSSFAKTCIRLLGRFGLPSGKEFQRFSSNLEVFFGIDAEKEVAPAQFVEEEVPQEEFVPVEKGWLFKKTVIEKQIVMKKVKKKVKGPQKVPKTVQELITELAQFV